MPQAKIDELLSAVTATGPGNWQDVRDFVSVVIIVEGIVAGDVVQIEGTPSDITGDVPAGTEIQQVGADLTADGFYELSAIPAAIRANLSANAGGGTVTVTMVGRRA